ncbi:MAG: hypothetical protein ACYTFW_15085 [Planctomycetota bacterium]
MRAFRIAQWDADVKTMGGEMVDDFDIRTNDPHTDDKNCNSPL